MEELKLLIHRILDFITKEMCERIISNIKNVL